MKDDGMPTASETTTAQRDSIEQSKRTNGLMVRRATIEAAAALADAEYNEQARLATFHHGEGDYGAMDRRNAAATSASRIAAAIRAMPVQTP